jgi:hypothetical protein
MSEREGRIAAIKLTQFVWLLFGLLEALLALRIGLKLIGANPANPFAAFIYALTGIFLWPFAGLVGTPRAGGLVLEISSLIGMLVYALIAWALVRLIWLLFYRPADRTIVHEVHEVHDETLPPPPPA